MRTVSLRRRVSLASLLVLAAALLAFDTFLYLSFSGRLTGDLHRQLNERAQLARSLASSLPPQQLADRLASGGITARVISGGHSYLATPLPPPPRPAKAPGAAARAPASQAPPAAGAEGAAGRKPAAKTPGAKTPGAKTPGAKTPGAKKSITGSGGATGPEPANSLTLAQPLPNGERLVLSADRTQLDDDLTRLAVLELAGTLIVLAAAGALLGAVLGRALRPLDLTTSVAGAIADGDIRQRLAPTRADTELGRMAQAFDRMLDRLQAALEKAHDSEERMRQFLADAAHELRTPVQALQATAETLLREGDEDENRQQVAVRMIRDCARAGRLIDDLLTLSRLDGDPQLDPKPFDLAELCREQLARAEVMAPLLMFRYEGPIRCPLEADRDRITQVIANLLDNARHATPEQGRITVAVEPGSESVTVAVCDNGPGIPAADRERIFERFVRLDPSRSRASFGSGLGLSIARRIALAHGGSLRCVSPSQGRGARFELTLPLRSSAGASHGSQHKPTAARGAG